MPLLWRLSKDNQTFPWVPNRPRVQRGRRIHPAPPSLLASDLHDESLLRMLVFIAISMHAAKTERRRRRRYVPYTLSMRTCAWRTDRRRACSSPTTKGGNSGRVVFVYNSRPTCNELFQLPTRPRTSMYATTVTTATTAVLLLLLLLRPALFVARCLGARCTALHQTPHK